MAVYKENEFKAFIELIGTRQTAHWVEIANILGVNKNTITAWKRRPEAQEAITKGIAYALDQMQEVGGKDWRMWLEKVKMLGLTSKLEVEAAIKPSPVEAILKSYGLIKENGEPLDSV